jgi:hypothetical protein
MLEVLPETVHGYVEPWFDDGAALLAVLREHPDAAAVVASPDAGLIAAWEAVRADAGAFVDTLRFHDDRHRDSYYAAVLGDDEAELDLVRRGARFAYLRSTRPGREAVPVDAAGIRQLGRMLARADVTFTSLSPFELLPRMRDEDVVFIDPAEGAPDADERSLTSFIGAATARGAFVVAPAPRAARGGHDAGSGWPALRVVNGLEGREAVWGNGTLLRARRRSGNNS